MEVVLPYPTPSPHLSTAAIKCSKLYLVVRLWKQSSRWGQRQKKDKNMMVKYSDGGKELGGGEGGKMVVKLVGAFKELTERMNSQMVSSSSSRLLFKALKLSIPILQNLPVSPDGRSPLSKALSLALLLADLQMDAEVISASILTQVFEEGAISLHEIRDRIGTGTALLLHESLRVKNVPSRVEVLDDEGAAALRKFCLTYYDIRAIILDLALKLDMMRHLDYLPRYHQQMLALQVMKIHAPLAHAIGTNSLSLELEDLAFHCLFPVSYLYLDTWLCSLNTGSNKPLIDVYTEELHRALKDDPVLADMVDGISVKGRFKSRFSTMKKLLKDGRKPEEVNDVLGLRVILKPKSGQDVSEIIGEEACYRAREIIQSLWKEMPHRTKDYIGRPKANGYRSLHMAVDVSGSGKTRPPMEIQIRTMEMDMLAADGTASHSLYKGGLTDPEEAKQLKAIMMAAAEFAALRLRDHPSSKNVKLDLRDRVFQQFDKNGDGRISIEELMEVMEELGAPGEDAQEMMQLLDSNSDGSLSSDEFDTFQKQVEFMRALENRDDEYKLMLNEKLKMLGR
ncbi:probable GTP diphosphokinase CRSH, chloroplastic [Mercurialis annua]|uniref:probable GTP diphosphokinase CRSH, chloroplastic n=1 Tax=Mercurialis annua TaxID=3986 RepID=UPI00215E2799|nr:probable GTP diphosphokinase CRSH, chloroplastic [Mercurialis annua]XP_050218753.1 probable GTP diphosphokinase CRSH, chloroplastic [Mercurialis annua]